MTSLCGLCFWPQYCAVQVRNKNKKKENQSLRALFKVAEWSRRAGSHYIMEDSFWRPCSSKLYLYLYFWSNLKIQDQHDAPACFLCYQACSDFALVCRFHHIIQSLFSKFDLKILTYSLSLMCAFHPYADVCWRLFPEHKCLTDPVAFQTNFYGNYHHDHKYNVACFSLRYRASHSAGTDIWEIFIYYDSSQ